MSNKIDKRCIFITSLGRTGTHFLGYNMLRMIRDSTSVHQPDVMPLVRPHLWPGKIIKFGLYRMTLGKFSYRYSPRALNIARQSGRLTDSQVIDCLRALRAPMLEAKTSGVYLEANGQLSGLADLLPKTFPNARVVYIVRDPRHWVSSWFNKKVPIYSRRDYMCWYRNGRLNPSHVKGDPYVESWSRLSPFERICWAWARETSFALEQCEKVEAVRFFRFEDLFGEDTRDRVFKEMLDFVTSFPDGASAEYVYRPELLERKEDSTSGGSFPRWPDWDDAKIEQLHRHCGPLMERFGYGVEQSWRERLSRLEKGEGFDPDKP